MTGISDEDGAGTATFSYDEEGRLTGRTDARTRRARPPLATTPQAA
ncbi:hypothetical protein I2W78_15380 [Streptomyces spinoverrucosus]|nr:hypothetical protein [Streptomyces spinoverrucosus]MBG0853195.1 hypothetical protein [Streptomyces spinoverrucosus]